MRIAVLCSALIVAPLALSGCSANWEGERRAAEERCELAAELLLPAVEAPDSALAEALATGGETAEGAAQGDSTAQPVERLSRAELAEALRAHVPEDLYGVLDLYAQPDPTAGSAVPADGSETQEEIVRVLEQRAWAEEAMRGWAQISCTDELAATTADDPEAAPTALPGMEMVQLLEFDIDGVKNLRIAGALEPDHAVALCEEARATNPDASIEVTDSDGFVLALAAVGEPCGYNPILLEDLESVEAGETVAE